ncbi:MAG: hypothetical protein QOK38_4184 [Acidobacteriaceae bacterium]|jgi:hypothetical protein|nr:hypothetical protein [Acidobacteriaceae bacterium]
MDHASIRPLLVDKPFQKMGQDSGCDYAQHQVIGLPALTLVACARSQPKARRDHIEHMFIGGPGQKSSRTLDGRACIPYNSLSDPLVELRRAEMPPRHHQSRLRETSFNCSRGSIVSGIRYLPNLSGARLR